MNPRFLIRYYGAFWAVFKIPALPKLIPRVPGWHSPLCCQSYTFDSFEECRKYVWTRLQKAAHA